jgi:hypothetical protein
MTRATLLQEYPLVSSSYHWNDEVHWFWQCLQKLTRSRDTAAVDGCSKN